jgi:hypothetical protein
MGNSQSTDKIVFAYRNTEEPLKKPTQMEKDFLNLDQLLNGSLFSTQECAEGTLLTFDELSSFKNIYCCSQRIANVSSNICMLRKALVMQLYLKLMQLLQQPLFDSSRDRVYEQSY